RLRLSQSTVGAYLLDFPVRVLLQESVNPARFLCRALLFAGTAFEVYFADFIELDGEPLRQFVDESHREASNLSISASIAPNLQIAFTRSLRRAMFGSSPVTPSRRSKIFSYRS